MSATGDIQIAIYSVLSADSTLADLSLTEGTDTVMVYNDVPEGAGYPHVLIGKSFEDSWDTFGGPAVGLGYKDVIRIHTYSRYQGDAEAYAIHKRVVALLRQPITVSGFQSAFVKYDGHRMFVEAVEKIETRHIVGEFYAWVKE